MFMCAMGDPRGVRWGVAAIVIGVLAFVCLSALGLPPAGS